MKQALVAGLMLGLAAAGSARAQGYADFAGGWADSEAACAQGAAFTVTPASARTIHVTPRGAAPHVHDFTAGTSSLSLKVGPEHFVLISPKGGKLTVGLRALEAPRTASWGGLALSHGQDKTLVRCGGASAGAQAAANTGSVAGTGVAALAAAEARYRRTFGPDWLIGSWGVIEADYKPVNGVVYGSCPSGVRAYNKRFGTRLRDGVVVSEAKLDGVPVKINGYWTFYKDAGGKLNLVHDMAGRTAADVTPAGPDALKLAVTLPEGSGPPKPQTFTLTLDGLALARDNEAGEWVNIVREKAPTVLDPSWFVLKVQREGRSPLLMVKCR